LTVVGAKSRDFKDYLNWIASAIEWLLPFVAYLIRRHYIQQRLDSDPTALPETVATYSKLNSDELEKRLSQEHERAKALDEKTFKMTLSLALGMTILGSAVAVLVKDLGDAPVAIVMQWGVSITLFYILAGGFLALTSLATLPTYGYSTGFKAEVKTASAPIDIYVDALLRQEAVNQIRQLRNEAAFQSLRNGSIVFAFVLLLYFLVWGHLVQNARFWI
jgi:hypothetical protein